MIATGGIRGSVNCGTRIETRLGDEETDWERRGILFVSGLGKRKIKMITYEMNQCPILSSPGRTFVNGRAERSLAIVNCPSDSPYFQNHLEIPMENLQRGEERVKIWDDSTDSFLYLLGQIACRLVRFLQNRGEKSLFSPKFLNSRVPSPPPIYGALQRA